MEPSLKNIQLLLANPPVKKTDECYKFVLIRILSFARREIQAKLPYEVTNDVFYSALFKETSEREGVPLSEYHYPLTREYSNKVYLNAKYFSRIFKCRRLVEFGVRLIGERIHDSHLREIHSKLSQIVLKWEKMFQRSGAVDNESVESLLMKVFSKKRYSIPWTFFELDHAIRKYQKFVAKMIWKNQQEGAVQANQVLIRQPGGSGKEGTE